MPRVCTICTHSQREAIDAALVAWQRAQEAMAQSQVQGGQARQRLEAEIAAAISGLNSRG